MEEEDHWRDKDFVRIVTVLDIVFAVLIFGFEISRLFFVDIIFPIAATSTVVAVLISIAFWLFLFILNILQIFIAFKLFVQVNQSEPDIHSSIQASRVWFAMSLCLLIMVFVQVVILLLLKDQPGKTFGFLLVIFSGFFRVAGLYFVKEFIDDLKAEVAQRTPVRIGSVRVARPAEP